MYFFPQLSTSSTLCTSFSRPKFRLVCYGQDIWYIHHWRSMMDTTWLTWQLNFNISICFITPIGRGMLWFYLRFNLFGTSLIFLPSVPPLTVSLADKQRKLVAGIQYTFSCLAKVFVHFAKVFLHFAKVFVHFAKAFVHFAKVFLNYAMQWKFIHNPSFHDM